MSLDNPADMLTKFLNHDLHSKHASYFGYNFQDQRECKFDDTVKRERANCELLVRIRYFAKHVSLAETQRTQIIKCLDTGI